MPTSKKPSKETLRSRRVSILRQRAQVVGSVRAKDERAAEAAAVSEFNLSDEQRKRLVVQERE
jgi:F0F1-type ATP synthase delta subunit